MLNAADEVAVGAFLNGRIGFPAIGDTITAAVERWGDDEEPSLDRIIDLDAEVRRVLADEIG